MSQSVLLNAKGLHTFKNDLGQIPEGALEEALNIVIDRDGIIEPRRGVTQYTGTAFADPTKQLLNYKRRILTHHGTTLSFEDGSLDGSFSDFAGSYSEITAGRRINAIESNGNLYFTSSEGIKKISAATASDFTTASGYITQAGGPKALDIEASVDYSQAGFFTPLSKVAYKVVWGITDANDNLILGAPSSRVVVENKDAAASAIVDLVIPIPDEVTNTAFFYQVYRTPVVTAATLNDLANIDPGEEFNLIFEEFATSAEITAGQVVTEDITPEDFRANGAFLYTNPVSGEGIDQSNEAPPFATDIETYKGYTFYSNTSTRHQANLSFLSISQINDGDSVSITDGTTTRTYTFRGSIETYTADFTATTKADLDGNYFIIASADDETIYKIWYDNTGSTTEPAFSGAVSIKVDIQAIADVPADLAQETLDVINANSNDFNISILGNVLTIANANNGEVTTVVSETIGGSFSLSQDGLGTGEDASSQEIFLPRQPTGAENGPSVSQQLDQVGRSMVRVVNSDTSSIVRAFYISTFNDVPGQMFFDQATLTGPAFNIYASNASVASQFNPTIGVTGVNEDEFESSNEVRPNRIYYSKFQQPEAVPLLNFIDVGPKDQEIQRIVALRDSLFIFKQDGIYRLSGDIAPFSVAPFDFSLTLQAPDTAVVLNNQVHCFTTQGVAQVTDTGVNVISRNIEDKLLEITREGFAFNTASFGVSYETDRAYLLWTVTESTDTVATQCFRYNAFTGTWTRWDLEKTCGIVNQRDNKLYLGASDLNIIEVERKGLDRTDYADRQFDNIVTTDGVDGDEVGVGTTTEIEIGDAILQTQYLTIAQYNRLLRRLDVDSGVADTDYFSTLEAVPGNTMRAKVTALAQKLDLDTGVTDTDYESSLGLGLTFPDIQADFNIIIGKLNLDTGVTFQDYDESTGTVPVEAVVVEIIDPNVKANTVKTNFSFPFVSGEMVHYKAIETESIYSPQIAGDVSLFKQFSEGTFMFENNNFTTATVGYKSDLSPAFEDIEFDGSGVGDWGQFKWSNQNWGGFSSAKPLRTYIPRQKQRCRFLQPRMKHKVAFEKYSLLGISLTFRPYSTKAYR